MSADAMELVLYDLGVKREVRTAFGADAAAVLARYALDDTEAGMIRDFDIAGLQARGVSPLLTYGFWLMNAPTKTRAAYLERLRQGT
ncbi:MAG: extradiol ring-cleavage dioxygenase [Comamonadaceae bacterium]|nr:MAG: extradiol ring-cleavage dioxygenase [Comamonadaceae bacterium]